MSESQKPELRFYLAPAAVAAGASFKNPRSGDAGFDLASAAEIVLAPGEQATVPTGLYLSIPIDWVGLIRDRSSMALQGLRTHAGVIDSAYRGEVRVVVSNGSGDPLEIHPGDRVAQLIVVPCLTSARAVGSGEELGDTTRGGGGFGSTGR